MLFSTLFSCQSGEEPQADAKGYICLSMPAEPFVSVDTRTVQEITDLDGFEFTLSGTDGQGETVNSKIIFNKEGNSYISTFPAGTYTLAADNQTVATTGPGAPYYQGTSASFTLSPGGRTEVSIELGKPQNAEIILLQDASFSSLYELQEVAFNDGSDRNNILTSNGKSYVMAPADGIVTYTIKASAREGSHVSDLPADGVKGKLTVVNGHSYTLNLTSKTISDIIIGIGDGEHDGEFE